MPEITITQAFLAFLAALFGETLGVFGGGGFLIQPALLAIGVPPHLVVSHDASSTAGASATSYYVFNKHKKVKNGLLIWWLPGVIIGPFLGIALLSVLSPAILEKIIIIVSLMGAVLILFNKKDWGGTQSAMPRQWKLLSLVSGLAFGFWAGFSGMGAGTISLMILVFLFGQTIKEAIATKTLIHLITESITAIVFLLKGWLVWQLFLPMFVGCLLAGYLKAHIILHLPEKLLKTLFLISVFITAGIALVRN